MKNIKEVRNLKKNQKQLHLEKTKQIIDENNQNNRLNNYKKLKKMKLWHWCIVIGTIVFIIGLSFIVGVTSKNKNIWEGISIVSLSFSILFLVIILILGFIKNQNAAKFYNNRQYRYRNTLEDNEAKISLWRKILIFIFIPLLIFVIVVSVIM